MLSGGLERIRTVQVWITNQTHHFLSRGNRTVTDNKLKIQVDKDSIVTISSWFNGQKKGRPSVPVPSESAFPLPHSDDFDGYPVDAQAKYFADNGGSFQVASAPAHAAFDGSGKGRGMVMKQWVVHENGVNRWGRNVNPITVIGNSSWVNVTATVDVLIGAGSPPPPPPKPQPSGGFYHWQNAYNGECLDLESNRRDPGSRVDVWTCVSANNEQFAYDAATGHLVEKTSKDCVSTGPCGAGADLCIVPCANAASMNSTWDVDHKAGTIKPRGGKGDRCLQTASKILDASVFLGEWDRVELRVHVLVVQTTMRMLVCVWCWCVYVLVWREDCYGQLIAVRSTIYPLIWISACVSLALLVSNLSLIIFATSTCTQVRAPTRRRRSNGGPTRPRPPPAPPPPRAVTSACACAPTAKKVSA